MAENKIDENIERTGVTEAAPVEDAQPSYKMFADARIPVSKAAGLLWSSRIEQARSARKDIEDVWSEAIRYYDNDQMQHRGGADGRSGNSKYSRLISDKWTETENLVFANATTMLPMLYAKNPTVECTPANQTENEPFAKCAEKLINTLLSMKEAPGVNIKSKARRAVLTAYLCNRSYLKVGYTDKLNSSEQTINELIELSQQLEKAKSKKAIIEIEGRIAALEQRVNILAPAGPTISYVSPFRIFVDPSSMEPDHSDANWMAEYDFIQTSILNAVYGTDKDGKIVSVYEPTHVLRAGKDASSIEDEVNNFSLFKRDENSEAAGYGYKDTKAFDAAKYTKVWYVWDKTTRRLFLFSDGDWKWPLWVWDDPLKLLGFFPYASLWFHETPEGSQPKGEVTYYLDQQDSVNDINSQIKNARSWVSRNIFYNADVFKNQSDVEQVLKGPDGTARGIKGIPDGTKLADHIYSFAPPAMQFPELFSTDTRLQSINRITGINDAQRGAQFKTNTTNQAIDAYQKNVDIRIDEKVDAIEDWLGNAAWMLLQICVQKYDVAAVTRLVGPTYAAGWQQVDPQELRERLFMQVIGGSTDKPTSTVKRQQALQVAQVLGQFANGIPALGIVAIQTLEKAFDEITVTPDQWQMVFQSMQAVQNNTGGEGSGGAGSPEEQQLQELIAQLPPEQKAQLEQLVQQGVPPTQALEQVVAQTQNQPIQ